MVEMAGQLGMANYVAHSHENSWSTNTAWTGLQEQAASHSKNTGSMYVAMLVISVTKAIM